MKLRYLVISATTLILCCIVYTAFTLNRVVTRAIPNAYALEWVGGMMVDYLRQNDDQWPQSWENLRPIYQQHVSEVGQAWTFEELKSRVNVRWDIDVEQVRALASPPDDLIVLRNGGNEHWAGHEPNEMIYRHLIEPEPPNP